MKNALPSVRSTISVTKLSGGREPDDRLDVVGHVGCGEGSEFDPVHSGVAMKFGQQQPERMLSVQIVGAEARHDEEPLIAEVVSGEGQQLACRTVRPVDVLDDQRHGAVGSEALQEIEECREEVSLTGRQSSDGSIARARYQRSQGRGYFRHDARRSSALESTSTTGANGSPRSPSGKHPPRSTSASTFSRELREQPRLANSGVAAEQDERRVARGRVVESCGEPMELVDTIHEPRLSGVAPHGPKYRGRGLPMSCQPAPSRRRRVRGTDSARRSSSRSRWSSRYRRTISGSSVARMARSRSAASPDVRARAGPS